MMDFPIVPAGVETLLSISEVTAGTSVDVVCRIFDASGMTIELEELPRVQITTSPMDSLQTDAEIAQRYMALRAGAVALNCAYPSLGLIDETPETLTITPGAPEHVVTTLDKNVMRAGQTAEAACEVFDAFGNRIDDIDPEITIEPSGDGIAIEGKTMTVTTAGLYTVACRVDGAGDVVADTLEVSASRGATMTIAKVPDQEVYGLGQVVTIDATVSDRFGNVIEDAAVEVTSEPEAVRFGDDRFRFDSEGRFVLTARVTTATENGLPVEAQTEVIVNGAGPDIACANPSDGSMLNRAPGSDVEMIVQVADTNGVQSVIINNQMATLGEDGTARANIQTRFGINFIDVIATDSFGERNTRTCAFLVSNRWLGEGAFLDDGVTLRLSQAAIDDSNRSGGLNSLADLLHTVLNSAGLRNSLDGALRGASPFIDRCVQDVCLPFVGCNCVFRLRVSYNSLTINGPNDASLQLINGGLRAVATVRGIRLGIGIGGTVSTSGTATLNSMTMDMNFDMNLRNNRPQVTVRSVSVNVGGVSTNFSGLAGFVIDIIVGLFEGTVRNLLRDQIRNFVQAEFDAVLDGVVSGLDISSLGASFDVPKLDGGTIPVGFGVRFSFLNATVSRALFGLGVRLSGPIVRGGPTLGAPLPPGDIRLDPTTGRPLAAGIHVGILSQALHVLWRAGMFDANINGGTIGAPGDVQVQLSTGLPPVLESLGEGRVRVSIGAARVSLVYPGLFNEPLELQIGAIAESAVRLENGDELRFDDITIQELIFSTDGIALDPTTRGILEDFLRTLVQSIVDDALNSALPALPIPSFALPNSFDEFGIPRGSALGLRNPSLSTSPTHVLLEGNFGTQ